MGRRLTRIAVILAILALAMPAAPLPALAAPSLEIRITWTRPGLPGTLQPPAALRVGDTVTIELEVADLNHRACEVLFQHLDTNALMSAGQTNEVAGAGLDACPAWTFVVPPAPAGTIHVHATTEGYPEGQLDEAVSLIAPALDIPLEAGGAPQSFTSTYPTSSWAPVDFLGTDSPSFGGALTFAMPPGATRACNYFVNGDFQTTVGAAPAEYESCAPWEVTLPDLRPSALWPQPHEWQAQVGIGSGSRDATIGSWMAGFALSEQVRFSGNGDDIFESSLPMLILSEASNPRYVLVGSEITVTPRAAQIEDGSECSFELRRPDSGKTEFEEFTTSVVDGACEPIAFVAEETGFHDVFVKIPGPFPEPGASRTFEVVEPMPEPSLDYDDPEAGEAFDVSSSVGAGLPSQYEFVLEPSGAAATGAVAGASGTGDCGSGFLDIVEVERSAAGRCDGQASGSYALTVQYRDATGASRTRTEEIAIRPAWADVLDIGGHSLEEHIRWLYDSGIASGCADQSFCPDAPVTRGQMATFLARALDLPPTPQDFFGDDESSSHELSINRLAAAGIASGCAADRFCPNSAVTRGQMATFLSRALDLPPTSDDFFADDEGTTHEVAINRVAAAGIARGCTSTRFCPSAPVTRAQMAAFLHRALAP